MSIIAISKQTAAATSDFNIAKNEYQPPCSLVANGLAGVESIAVQVSDDNGLTFAPLMDYATGVAVVMDATHNQVTIRSSGKYRVVKPVTVALVGVSLSTLTNS